ncbi:MAG: hypothetical protein ACXVB9_04020 [Bdellovibrionota bacterium]
MNTQRKEIHAKQVAAWEALNTKDLPNDQLVRIFAKAIQTLEQRSLVTLSSVTVMVVVDRAVHESKEKHPLLAEVKIEPEGIDLGTILTKSRHFKTEELRSALRYLLVELLAVLANITADILTGPLHKELAGVTLERALTTAEPQALRMVKALKTNREDT